MLHEIGLELEKVEKNVLTLFTTFSNGDKIIGIEASHPGFAFALRVLYRYFLENNIKDVSVADFLKSSMSTCEPISLLEAIQIIVKHYRENNGLLESDHVVIYLGVDEYQRSAGVKCYLPTCTMSPSDKDHDFLRHIVNQCASLSCSAPISNSFFFPVFAGVQSDVWHPLVYELRWYYNFLPLNVIPANAFLDLIQSGTLQLREQIVPKFLLDIPKFLEHINILSGIMGSMVGYVDSICKIEKMRTTPWKDMHEDTFEKCFKSVNELFKPGRPISFTDLANCILQELVSPSDLHISGIIKILRHLFLFCIYFSTIDGQKKGCWFVTKAQKMVIPLLALKTFKEPESNATGLTHQIQLAIIELLQSLWVNVNSTEMIWQKWERFCAFFFALKYNCMLLLGRSSTSLSTFHQGAILPSKMSSVVVRIGPNPIRVISLDTPLDDPSSTTKRHLNTNVTYDFLTDENVFLNAPGAKGIGLFKVWHTTANNNLIFDGQQQKFPSEKLSDSKLDQIKQKAFNQIPNHFSTPNNNWFLGDFSNQSEVSFVSDSHTYCVGSEQQLHTYFGQTFIPLSFMGGGLIARNTS